MMSHTAFKILLIILLILLAAPLLGALAMMATGDRTISQAPQMMNGRMIGLATICIGVILILIVTAIVSMGRSLRRRGSSQSGKEA